MMRGFLMVRKSGEKDEKNNGANTSNLPWEVSIFCLLVKHSPLPAHLSSIYKSPLPYLLSFIPNSQAPTKETMKEKSMLVSIHAVGYGLHPHCVSFLNLRNKRWREDFG